MPSFAVPLSGLDANSSALSAISNNLANLNTVAYKTSEAEFRDLFYQTVGISGDGAPLQVGVGSAVSTTSTQFTQGSIESNGVTSNAAIQGDGLFVVDRGGRREYSRAGNFIVSSAGNLVTPEGANVMGYPATAGVVSTNSAPVPIKIELGQLMSPQATSAISMRLNLDASAAVGAQHAVTVPMYDSLGFQHDLSFSFTKIAVGQWAYHIDAPGSDFTNGGGSPVGLSSGVLNFDPQGALQSLAPVQFSISGLSDGAAAQALQWNVSQAGGSGAVTQQASPSATIDIAQNGYSGGQLTNYSIANDGTVQGTFSNGQTLALGQLCLAAFTNMDGLERVGDNSYRATLGSGNPIIGVPGTQRLGSLTGGALELSNVDIAREFSKLIIAQRGFQANAKAITTFDEIAQDTINIKR